MQLISHYLHRPHAPGCDCSVCFVTRLGPVLPNQWLCADCQPPGRPYLLDGRWLCRRRSYCVKHDPSRRPPKYWHVVYDSGKPTPFVPIREPFELEG